MVGLKRLSFILWFACMTSLAFGGHEHLQNLDPGEGTRRVLLERLEPLLGIQIEALVKQMERDLEDRLQKRFAPLLAPIKKAVPIVGSRGLLSGGRS